MKILIVEDEKLAAERLQTLVHEYDSSIEVVACLESIEDTVDYLKHHAQPDLILMDIHLSDGHSFEIFKQVRVDRPVIFTTAYDQYALEAFKIFSIDYILKPVSLRSLAAAINKYKSLSQSFIPTDLSRLSLRTLHPPAKKRFLGKVGQRLFFIELDDIAYFQADNKIVHLVDREGNRFVVDYTLERLEQLLDSTEFFRLNRRFIVRVSAIQQVKPYFNNRLKIAIKGCNAAEEDMVISRDRVAEFRAWAENA